MIVYSDATLAGLATHAPGELLRLVRSGLLVPVTLARAAEAAGRLPDSAAVRAALVPLLDHQTNYVREAALYGLATHLDAVTRALLAVIVADDASPGVRAAARDVLDDD